MALMTVLESDLRALSAEARRRYPAVKDAAEHAILKLRILSSPSEIAENEDILRIFLMACDVKSVKLSVIALSSIQKLISHHAVAPSALGEILFTLKEHAEMMDESVQLKTLQTVLIILQSQLHPENEENMTLALGISLRLLESARSSDSVRNTAAATFRQAVALIFDSVVAAEDLPTIKINPGSQISRSSSVTDNVSRSIIHAVSFGCEFPSGHAVLKESLSKAGKLGLHLLEDLTALAAGGSAVWLKVHFLQRTFALEILEFILSNYPSIFCMLVSYEQVLRHQICSLLLTSLRTNIEMEGEAGEPIFRRLVLRSVAHVIRLYSSSLVTECEVFLNTLIKVTCQDLPLWHRILVLEVFRGFCVEVRTLRLLFQNFDLDPKNTNVVENMVKALSRIVSIVQVSDTSEESLVAVAGMFSSKAKGIEWSMDNDVSNAAVVIASEAHAITLAVEGILGVVFTIATLTDEAVDSGEVESPKSDADLVDPQLECRGKLANLCTSMVNSTWLTILDSLSLILSRSHGEAIILEVLKGYQAFTQVCGVLRVVEPLNSFLASLCKFTINIPNDMDKKSALSSPGSRRPDISTEQRDNIILTPKNVQALRTLFNVAHRLHNVLGPSWVLVLETLAALDRAIHSPHSTTKDVSSSVSRLTRDTSGIFSDFNILSSLNCQLFESAALMHISAVKSLLSALRQLSNQCISGNSSVVSQATSQQTTNVAFSVERITLILENNLHRVEHIWDEVVGHLLELAENFNVQLRNLALDALDKSICAVLGSEKFHSINAYENQLAHMSMNDVEVGSFECAILSPLLTLYSSSQNLDVRSGSLKILLHVLERHGEKLRDSWPSILDLLRDVSEVSEKDIASLGFQCVRIIINDGLSTIPSLWLHGCIVVAGSYGSYKNDVNISLTSIGLLWTATDFIVKGLDQVTTIEEVASDTQPGVNIIDSTTVVHTQIISNKKTGLVDSLSSSVDHEKMLFSVFNILQKLGADERPEVRNSSIRTLFQTLGAHGHKLSSRMWEDCLKSYVFPILESVTHLASTSSKDEWQGKELGFRGGKAVHMLIHHSRNTAQKQWDETLVVVLGGITRLLRSFFPFLQSLSNFSQVWASLLNFVKDSILNGSKEVALAAISCLHATISSHCSKGNVPTRCVRSVLDVYELVLQSSSKYWMNSTNKVKQETLSSLGDLYVQAQLVFDDDMYVQLLGILHVAIKNAKSDGPSSDIEVEYGDILPVERSVLEILTLLCPAEHLKSMWCHFLRVLLDYLYVCQGSSHAIKDELESKSNIQHGLQSTITGSQSATSSSFSTIPNNDPIYSSDSVSLKETDTIDSDLGSPRNIIARNPSQLFGQRLLPFLVKTFLRAPPFEKCDMIPETIHCLRGCMSTRRDEPRGILWRLAVEGFNTLLVDDIHSQQLYSILEPNFYKIARARFWKEIADVYEIFLVGSCGRALSSDAQTFHESMSDEAIDNAVLKVLGDELLKAPIDAPTDVLHRLVLSIDHCASRTGSLPLESLGLIPSSCSNFFLSCLRMIFSLCRYSSEDGWHSKRSEISKISIPILLNRCDCILNQFFSDEGTLGENPVPLVRFEETIFVLQELARLVLHKDTASVLRLNPCLMDLSGNNTDSGVRSHLLVLFSSLCKLVTSRESRIRTHVQVLLGLIAAELKL